jgi:hypothetical protein
MASDTVASISHTPGGSTQQDHTPESATQQGHTPEGPAQQGHTPEGLTQQGHTPQTQQGPNRFEALPLEELITLIEQGRDRNGPLTNDDLVAI